MIYLLTASLIWAFSFGLIKTNLSDIDPVFISSVRLLLSSFIFIPFIIKKKLENKLKLRFVFLGGIQYGLMYVFYILSYKFLLSYEVALFTIFTPLYVSIIYSFGSGSIKRALYFVSSASVLATGIILWSGINSPGFLKGFFLMQLSNICFAWGQLEYKKVMNKYHEIRDIDIFGYLYIGGFFISLLFIPLFSDSAKIYLTVKSAMTLIYLGIVASGIAFFLWNYGAKRSRVSTLSVFNNVKIPVAVLVSIVIFGEEANLPRLLSGLIILAVLITFSEKKRTDDKQA